MDVVRQHLSLDHLHTSALAGARNRYPHFARRALVNAAEASPCVPGDMRIHLECSMSRHVESRLSDPGRKPGVLECSMS